MDLKNIFWTKLSRRKNFLTNNAGNNDGFYVKFLNQRTYDFLKSSMDNGGIQNYKRRLLYGFDPN